MKIIPQHKAIGPYNYDRIIHNIEKIRYRSDKWKDAFSLKIKKCVIR